MAKLGVKQGSTRPEASQLTPILLTYLLSMISYLLFFSFFLFHFFTVYELILIYCKLRCLQDYKCGAGDGWQTLGMVNNMILSLCARVHTTPHTTLHQTDLWITFCTVAKILNNTSH